MSRGEDWFFDGLSDELRSILTDQTTPVPSVEYGTGVTDAHRGLDPAANHRERGTGSRAHGASDGPEPPVGGLGAGRRGVTGHAGSGEPHGKLWSASYRAAPRARSLARWGLYAAGAALFVLGLLLLAGCKPPAPHCPVPLVAVWHDNPQSGSPDDGRWQCDKSR